MVEFKQDQRIYGLVCIIVGGGFTVWQWYLALTEGYYYQKYVMIGPFFAVLGLGPLLFPINKKQLRKRYGVDEPQQLAHYPLSWKILFFVALAATLGNWAVISHL